MNPRPRTLLSLVAVVVALVVVSCSGEDLGVGAPGSTAAGSGAATSTVTGAVAATQTTAPVPELTPELSAIAERTAMTSEAIDVLAASAPALVDKTTLGTTCTLDQELSVLGCYRSGRIAVLAVTDARLDGMTETTTAHEMLHAAWDRLDGAEQERLSALLQEVYRASTDENLIERVEAYRTRDPSVVDNELHSIVGTEVADVGPELETYYARWFTDRSVVVDLAVTAQATFTDLEAQVADLDARLAELRTRITDEETTLAEDRAGIETWAAELDALEAAGDIEGYNAGVDPFNTAVAGYNTAVADHQAVVDEHNTLVEERNDLAAAYTDLSAQISTSVDPVSG